MRKDNSGFSLIEIVAALAILAIASVAILRFLNTSTIHYQKENGEVEVQYEAQVATNQITDLLIDALKGVKYTYNSSNMILSDADIANPATVTSKEITIYNDGVYYILTWDKADKKLYYTDYIYNASTSTWNLSTDKALMAEYIESFSVDMTNTSTNGVVRLKLLFKRDKEYEITQNVTIRNKVKVNAATIAEVYS